MKSISDRAEVSIDFPDKAYMGAFGRESGFDVKVEPDEVLLRIVRAGEERREVAVHLHYYLLGDILKELGRGLAEHGFLDDAHLHALQAGADALTQALKESKPSKG
ncbi:MAG: hypothetical protein JSR90_06415 [Proteobacteria bacterium]|nr:hypothetical protein [Pseudomonadota bacterium]